MKDPNFDIQLARLAECARQLDKGGEQAARAPAFTAFAATATDETFAEQLKRTVDRHPNSRKAVAERAARERKRYHRIKRRPHRKSD
jgi:hypothetical protein